MLHRSSEEEACIKYRSDLDAASYNPLGEVKAWARTTLSKISTNSTRVHTQQMLETSRRTNTSACWVIEKKWNDRWSSELPTLAVRFLFTNAIRNLWVQFYHFFHSFFFTFGSYELSRPPPSSMAPCTYNDIALMCETLSKPSIARVKVWIIANSATFPSLVGARGGHVLLGPKEQSWQRVFSRMKCLLEMRAPTGIISLCAVSLAVMSRFA